MRMMFEFPSASSLPFSITNHRFASVSQRSLADAISPWNLCLSLHAMSTRHILAKFLLSEAMVLHAPLPTFLHRHSLQSRRCRPIRTYLPSTVEKAAFKETTTRCRTYPLGAIPACPSLTSDAREWNLVSTETGCTNDVAHHSRP
jgi:hypothetical protein